MRRTRIIKVLWLLAVLLCSLSVDTSNAQAEPQDRGKLQLVKMTITDKAQLEIVKSLDAESRDVEIWSDWLGIGTVEVRILAEHKRRLEAAGIQYEVLIEDFQVLRDQLFGPSRDAGFHESYRTYEEHLAFMNELVALYPDLAELVNLGSSVRGRPLLALRITGPGEDKPGVMFHGGQHGNEIMGPCVIPYVAEFLLTNYGRDAEVTMLVDNVEWFLLPIMNPDGYVSGTRRNENDIDLNRNWGGPGCGSSPFSQPETAAMRDFFLAHPNVRAHIDFHTYSSVILWPWGHTEDHCLDHDTFADIAQPMHDRIFAVRGADYDMGTVGEVIYLVRGGSVDYTYGDLGIWAFVFELGYSHSMPPEEILPTCQEMRGAMTFLASWVSDCNDNDVSDGLDIAGGTSQDCTGNGIPDECEPDCNENDIPDSCDIADGTSEDCNSNGIPDECLHIETDCNANSVPDECDLADATSQDCDSNGIPDECDNTTADCNDNGVWDPCDITQGTSQDCTGNWIPDECEPDCNDNAIADSCDIADGTSEDCNENGVPEECEAPPALSRLYVDADASPAGDGSSWAHALNELRPAICYARLDTGTTEIWVAEGTYSPTCPIADLATSFVLPSGVAVYGGFAGWETSLAQRDWETNLTVLSGDLDGNDVPEDFPNGLSFTDNSYHVVTAGDVDATTILDGFAITGGNAKGLDEAQDKGGGIYNDGGSPTLRNLYIVRNNASIYGGGIYNCNQAATTVTNCTFDGNSAERGAALYNASSDASLSSCSFSGNRALVRGGAVYNYSGFATIADCTFAYNTANLGGGAYNAYRSDAVLTDCLFTGNSAEDGAGLNITYSDATLINCVVEYSGGRGMYNRESSPVLVNCTFSANAGGGVYNYFDSCPTFTGCAFYNNDGSAISNDIDSSPLILGCVFSGNVASYGGGVYSGGHCEPVLSNCLFSGNVANKGGAVYSSGSDYVLTGCTFSANRAEAGSAIAANISGGKSVVLSNCILWDGGNEIWKGEDATVVITYSDVRCGWPGDGNIVSDPLFVDPDGADGVPGTEDDDLRLASGSPCINTGDPAFVPEVSETDLDGHARVLCALVDMGAYEFGIGDYECDEDVDLDDFANWQACMTGPDAGPYVAGCEMFDFEFDGDVDLADFAAFQEEIAQ